MSLAPLIDRMIAAGMSAGEAGALAAEIYAAGVASVTAKTSGAARQQRYRERHQTSQSVTSLRSDEASQSVTNRNETSQSDASPNVPLSKTKIKNRERQNRGTRLASDWAPSETERYFAKQSGFSDFEISREVDKFRDYWAACAGAKGVKLDWSATWRQWIRNGADRAGKAQAVSSSDVAAAMDWDKILTSYKQFGHWSRYAGPSPDSPACLCPPEMLAKYGLVGDSQQPDTPLLRGMQ